MSKSLAGIASTVPRQRAQASGRERVGLLSRLLPKGDKVTVDGLRGEIRGLVKTEHGPGFLVKLESGGYLKVPTFAIDAVRTKPTQTQAGDEEA